MPKTRGVTEVTFLASSIMHHGDQPLVNNGDPPSSSFSAFLSITLTIVRQRVVRDFSLETSVLKCIRLKTVIVHHAMQRQR